MSEQFGPGAPDADDVQGHMSPRPTDRLDPVTDDVEGRRLPGGPAGAAADDEDDVEGHGLRPMDPKRA
jgi:hypothetical protein